MRQEPEKSISLQSTERGFSLIELLIVVAIILIIAAIAIPNLMRARISANESSAVASLKGINTAEVMYQTAYQSFSPDLASLGGTSAQCAPGVSPANTNACLLDSTLASATGSTNPKSGYYFALASTGSAYSINADPMTVGTSGVRHFFTNESGVIRVNPAAVAAASDESI